MKQANKSYPFGMLMPGRQFSTATGYRFGFNGKENDNELKGEGNSLDFGARIYDSRLGRWASLDPLQAKYPSLSAYNFCANSPIYFHDVDGRYFTGDINQVKLLFAQVSSLASDKTNIRAQLFKAAFERMDKSDIEFKIVTSTEKFDNEGSDGTTQFDFENNCILITLYSSKDESQNAKLAHELEHGRQFMDGETDFMTSNKEENIGNSSYNHDCTDENNAVDVEKIINEDDMDYEQANVRAKAQKNSYWDQDYLSDEKTNKNRTTAVSASKDETKFIDKNLTDRKYKSKFNYIPKESQKVEKKTNLSDEKK